MSDFNQTKRFSGGRGGQRYRGRDSGRRSFGDRNSPRPMHRATCAQCGNECEVPFRPSGDRPVYCSNCFEKRGNADGNLRESDRRNSSRSSDSIGNTGSQLNEQIVEQLRSLNTKLDKIIIALESKASKPKAPKKKVIEEEV